MLKYFFVLYLVCTFFNFTFLYGHYCSVCNLYVPIACILRSLLYQSHPGHIKILPGWHFPKYKIRTCVLICKHKKQNVLLQGKGNEHHKFNNKNYRVLFPTI